MNIKLIAENFLVTIQERDRYIDSPDTWEALNALAESLIPPNLGAEELEEFNYWINK